MSSVRPSRVRPTALSRYIRHASLSYILEIEEVEENIDIEEEVSEELTGPFLGGPYDIFYPSKL